jgi:hypothetical protein
MKTVIAIISLCMLTSAANAQGILGKIKDKAKQRADAKVDKAIDKGLDKTEEAATKKENAETKTTEENKTTSATEIKKDTPAAASAEIFKTFQNYDFVPGDKVLFEDDWRDDEVGEFPAHWKLVNGEFLVNKFEGNNVLVAK